MVRSLAQARILIGAAAFVAPKLSARLFAFPPEHDNGSARTMARLFGVRDIGLGTLALHLADDPKISRQLHRVIACVDGGDAAAGLVALARREGVDRGALGLVLVATFAAAIGLHIARAEDERAIGESIAA